MTCRAKRQRIDSDSYENQISILPLITNDPSDCQCRKNRSRWDRIKVFLFAIVNNRQRSQLFIGNHQCSDCSNLSDHMEIIAERSQQSKDRSNRVSYNLNNPSDYMELSHQRSRQLQRSNVFSDHNDPIDGNDCQRSYGNQIDSGKRAYFHKQTAA